MSKYNITKILHDMDEQGHNGEKYKWTLPLGRPSTNVNGEIK